MNIAPVSINDEDKLKCRNEYCDLDKIPKAELDDICSIAAAICNTPESLVYIIDASRQCISPFNLSSRELPDNFPFSGKDIAENDDIFIVSDLSKDPEFYDHIYVTDAPNAAFYAGIALVSSEGEQLGTLCILDTQSKILNNRQINALKSLGRRMTGMLELSGKTAKLEQKQAELTMAYADLAKIAHLASHDLKSPLNNIISITHLLKEEYGTKFDAEGTEYINYLNDAAYQLSDLISGLLSYSRSSQLLVEHKEEVDIAALVQEVNGLLNIPQKTVIKYPKEGRIYTSRIALKQILLHLFHNAIKYNTKDKLKIDMTFNEDDAAYNFEVKDNGPGIAADDQEKIFELFEKLQGKIKDGESMGIGLAIVKRLIEKLGGSIKVDSELNNGAAFIFAIPK